MLACVHLKLTSALETLTLQGMRVESRTSRKLVLCAGRQPAAVSPGHADSTQQLWPQHMLTGHTAHAHLHLLEVHLQPCKTVSADTHLPVPSQHRLQQHAISGCLRATLWQAPFRAPTFFSSKHSRTACDSADKPPLIGSLDVHTVQPSSLWSPLSPLPL